MGILDMIQHFMHEILVGSSHYFTSYCNESGHLCDLKGRGLSWAVKGKNKKYKIPFCRVESYLFGKVYLEGKKRY
jgi:hypothetical protein